MFYYIAYTIIAISLGGILFIFIKKLPRIFSLQKSELDDLREIIEAEKKEGWLASVRQFDFSEYWKKVKKFWHGLAGIFSKFMGKIAEWSKGADKKIKYVFGTLARVLKDGAGWAGALGSKINIFLPSFGRSKPEKELPSDKEEEEFFSELLKKDKSPEEKKEKENDVEKSRKKNQQEEAEPEEEKRQKQEQSEEKEETEIKETKLESQPPTDENPEDQKQSEEGKWIKKLKDDPKNETAYAKLGFLYYKQGKYEEAESCLQIAKKLGFAGERLERILNSIDQIT